MKKTAIALGLFLLLTNCAFAFSMRSGYYVGTGVARSITGIGITPDLIIIKADTAAGRAVWRSSAMTGDSTAYFENASANFAGAITALNTDGFTLGDDVSVNSPNVRYTWTAFGGSGGVDFKVGSYVGNGVDGRDLTGIGFAPDLVWVKRNATAALSLGLWYSSAMAADNSHYFSATAPVSDRIQALQAGGFQIGGNAEINQSGDTYYYVAFKAAAASLAVGSYTGDGTDNRSITGVGFKPDFVLVKQSAVTNAAVMRLDKNYGDESQIFTATANAVDHIQALENDGFQVGANGRVNLVGGSTYYYAAFKGVPAPSPTGKFKMTSGSYSGNGTSQTINNVGFQPDLVIIKSDTNAGSAIFRTSYMAPNTSAYLGVATANIVDGSAVSTLDNNGFSVGSGVTVNSTGVTYRWVAF